MTYAHAHKSALSLRTISDLRWAQLSTTNPWPKPRGLKGAKAKGIAYQNKVQAFLKRSPGFEQIQAGKWIEFCDINGRGYAQPDFFMVGPHSTILLESKLTENEWGHIQIAALYTPLLKHI